MTIGFILNGEDVIVKTNAESRLVDILRQTFNLLGARAGCYLGICGACSVIFNGEVVKSCLIPAFKIRDCEIITIEGFSQSDEYQDIIRGFEEAGALNCGFCNTGKVMITEALLEKNPSPEETDILKALIGNKCRCTENGSLVQGVLIAAEKRRQRINGHSH